MTDVVDSNIIIYSTKPDAPETVRSVMVTMPSYSRISELEVFGYPRITPQYISDLEKAIELLFVEEITLEVLQRAIALRQQKSISVPDSIIAATALLKNYRLVTRNVDDFDWIDGLQIYNPFDTPPAP